MSCFPRRLDSGKENDRWLLMLILMLSSAQIHGAEYVTLRMWSKTEEDLRGFSETSVTLFILFMFPI